MMRLLPNRVVFASGIGSPAAAIGQALDAIEDRAEIGKVADRLSATLGWDGSQAFWLILEEYKKHNALNL